MLQTSAALFTGLAVTLSLGAVQLESGDRAASHAGHDAVSSVVHRAVKSDLGITPPRSGGRTVSIRLESLPSMSIVLRIPGSSGQEAGDRATKQGLRRAPAMRVKRTVACEPVVSTLTDIAKQLQPGRCVT